MKQEIIEIIKGQKELGISVPFESPIEADISTTPEFYFITLNNNPEKKNASTPQQIMAGCLSMTSVGDVKNYHQKKVLKESLET